MDWRALLHNKWLLGGLAVAAAAGGFVLYRRSKTGGGSSASVGASNPSPAYSGGVGTFDSTGTDVAGWLGSYSGNLQNQLDQFAQQQADFLSALSQMQTSTPGAAQPAVTLPPHRVPPRYAPPTPVRPPAVRPRGR